MKMRFVIPALAMIAASAGALVSTSARAAAVGGTAKVTIDSAQYDFVATTCDFTGRGPQLEASLPDGTKISVHGPSDSVTVEGPSVHFGGWVENSAGDNRAFQLAGKEDGGSRTFFVDAVCQH